MSRREDGPAPDQPAFAAPWQAQAFALAVALNEAGLFSWSEWAETLGRHVGRSDAADDGSDYYGHWVVALEELLSRKGVAAADEVAALARAWERAAHATPHGKPILLANDPQGGG
ncbi:MAG: nitrile hydratase accessory protein [Rhizobiales bacterium 68-8]|nr:MAG: nitrile hydratase accessory protein [Rhizobiales bacterium 68-8]